MRHPFGGGVAAWAMVEGASSYAYIAPGAEVRAYNAPSGGLRIVDLALDQAGVNVVATIIADDRGQLPVFYGPDGAGELWLSANNGPRVRALPTDGGSILDNAAATLTSATASLTAIDATVGQPGGIADLDADGLLASDLPTYSLSSSDDVNTSGVEQGDSLSYSGSVWTPSRVDNTSYPTEWQILPLISGFSVGDSIPAYRFVDPTTVQIRGMVKKNNGYYSYGDPVLNLPNEIIPAVTWYPQVACATLRSMTIGVLSSGQLQVYPYVDNTTWVSLDGVLYDLAYGATGGPHTFTKRWDAAWSNTFDASNNGLGGNLCYQGNANDGRGNQRSLVGFDDTDIRAELAGATIVKVVLSLYYPWWWYNTGTALIGTHNYLSRPTQWEGARVNERRWSSANWPRHRWRDITLPNTVGDEFANGTTTGIAIGPAGSSSQTYYGYAYGAYDAAKPYLTITYQK